jgi:hypothetical protein
MNKRIVIEYPNGLRKIIGQMVVPAHTQFTRNYDSGDFGIVDFVKEARTYVLYRQQELTPIQVLKGLFQ